jgi:hypothetical protein
MGGLVIYYAFLLSNLLVCIAPE